MKCDLCAQFFNQKMGWRSSASGYVVCTDCVDSLIDNEAERRGEREEARRFAEYHGGDSMPEDREREQLREAGRIP